MQLLSTLHQLIFLVVLCGIGFPLPMLGAANVVSVDVHKPAILLAQNYHSQIKVSDYLVSEKLDGVRAFWDGKVLRFRSGQVIHSPAWFTAHFPTRALDGELWMGRRKFDLVSAATRRDNPLDEEWKKITYQLYELPEGIGTFKDRLTILHKVVNNIGVSWVRVVPQFNVASDHALQLKLRQIVRSGGEGLMLHRADAVWQTGRSDTLLKLKSQLDAEAKVIAYLPGKGKYEGMLGALLVEMPNGIRFRLGGGFSDQQRKTPPEIGSIVTYRYRDLTPQGLPRFANFLRVREME